MVYLLANPGYEHSQPARLFMVQAPDHSRPASSEPATSIVSLARARYLGRHEFPPLYSLTTIAILSAMRDDRACQTAQT